MSYAGLGTQTASFTEPPKDPSTSSIQTSAQTLAPVSSTVQNPLAPYLAPPPPSGQSMSDWRSQVAQVLETIGLVVMALPAEVVAQISALLATLDPSVRQQAEELLNWLRNPSKTDAQVAEKLNAVKESYRTLRPRLPAPAVRAIDPIADGVVSLVPANVRPATMVLTPISASDVPWLWIAGSFVAGMFVCSIVSKPKPTPNRRRVRRNRSRR